MKRKAIKLLSLLMILILVSAVSVSAFAVAPPEGDSIQSSSYINGVYASVTAGSGSVTVNFSITAKHQMTKLGAIAIVIYDSYGNYAYGWTQNASGMMGSNRTFYSSSKTWYGASAGTQYYADVAFKAIDSSGYDTAGYTTGFCTPY